MKKLILAFLLSGLLCGISFAYQATSQDTKHVNTLKTQFDKTTTGNLKAKLQLYTQIKTLQEQASGHAQLQYYFTELGNYLLLQINNEKAKVKPNTKQFKQNFLSQFSG